MGSHVAVHRGVGVVGQHRHGCRGRRAHKAGGRAGARFQGRLGGDGHVRRRRDIRALLNVDAGLHSGHADRHGPAAVLGHAVLVNAHENAGLRLGGHKAAVLVEGRPGIFGRRGDGVGIVHARVHLARDIHAGMGDLYIDGIDGRDVQRQADQGVGVQHRAGHGHLRDDHHVAGGIDGGLVGDDDP